MVVGAHGFSTFCAPFCCYRCVCGAGIRSRTNTTVCVRRAAHPTRRFPSRRTRSTAKSTFIRSFFVLASSSALLTVWTCYASCAPRSVVRRTKQRKQKEKNDRRTAAQSSKQTVNRKSLANVRVMQRNLVYAIGLPHSFADEDVRRLTRPSLSHYCALFIVRFCNTCCYSFPTDAPIKRVLWAVREDRQGCREQVAPERRPVKCDGERVHHIREQRRRACVHHRNRRFLSRRQHAAVRSSWLRPRRAH